MWAAACGPFLIVACTAAWLVVGRHAPAPLDDGQVLRLAGLMCMVFLLVQVSIVGIHRYAPRASASERRQIHRVARVMWAVNYCVALLYAGIVLHIPLGSPVVLALVIPGIVIAGLLWRWRAEPTSAAGAEPTMTAPAIDRDPGVFWTWLGFYDNPDDPHAIVPKPNGVGYRFNVGNSTGRRLMYMFFGLIALIIAAAVFGVPLPHP